MLIREVTADSSVRTGLVASLVLLTVELVSAVAFAAETHASPQREVTVDTRQGTWLNLDVSPDGRTLIFDLLGDLFVMPIEGGEARPLFSGRAWDALPRFSPDGRLIAFISDRSGADNVWIADANGEHPRQLSHETLRLPASPVWSPDGKSIAVRKHFTAREVIGAGEIWVYPVDGGEARRLVESPTTSTDINEPFFSPDGKSLYYSQEVWNGGLGAAYKNPHATIYATKRLALETGRSEIVAGAFGGAVRPTPSPDGARLAYIRRQGGDSALILRQLDSGVERVLSEGLDRDLQEIWAKHGLYPAFAWMPGGRELIFWSRGGFHRLNVETLERTEIPFHVRQHFTVVDPPRPVVPVERGSLPVRSLRWATVSPKGDRLIFQSLGHIYVRDLPAGSPRRLTRDDERFEFFPALSPDGEWVVYATWSDTELGSIRRTRIRDGETVELTRRPGHYLELAVSPDGRSVVFRRGAGGGPDPNPFVTLMTSNWGSEPGIYSVPWEGGEQKLIAPDGASPQFCADPNVLFVTRLRPRPDKPPKSWWNHDRVLTAIDLQSGSVAERAVAFANEFRLSPDCKWLARVERSRVSVAPFTREGSTARTEWHAPGIGGAFLSWSSDGRLHWMLGPTLISWQIRADGPAKPPTDRRMGFETAPDRPTQKIALLNARILTFDAAGIIDRGSLIFEGNRISAVGPVEDIEVPPSARVIDLAGATVIPGLFDLHWHSPYSSEGITPQQSWQQLGALAFGVTTIRDPYADDFDVFAAAELVRAGLTLSPRIFSTGTGLYGADKEEMARIETYTDALQIVRWKKALGAIAVKSYLLPQRRQQQFVIEAARAEGMGVPAEAAMAQSQILAQVMDGNTTIEHNPQFADVYDDVTQLWGQTKVGHTPTLVAAMGGLPGDQYWYQHTDVLHQPLLQKYVPPTFLRWRVMRPTMAYDEDQNLLLAARIENKLHGAGVRVFIGAHGMREGLGAHWEMWSLALGGMRPLDVLRAATADSARELGMDADLGTITRGKLADFVVLDADPLVDIRNTQRIRYVVANGRLYDVASMNEVGGKLRRPLFWESSEGAARQPSKIPAANSGNR